MFAVRTIKIIVRDSLYSVEFEDNYDEFENNEFVEDKSSQNEFRRVFNNWQDPEYLEAFFDKYKNDLHSEFYNSVSTEDAIIKTIQEAFEFQQRILSFAETGKKDLSQSLQTLFKPLNKRDEAKYPIPEYQKNKAYGSKKSWLRMYAIRIEDNVFIVAGGAIKLTKTMSVRGHLKKELEKLEEVKQFLISEGIINNESIIDFLEFKI